MEWYNKKLERCAENYWATKEILLILSRYYKQKKKEFKQQ
jgi:hypothetical protein